MSPFAFPDVTSAGLVVERHITIGTVAAMTGYNPRFSRHQLKYILEVVYNTERIHSAMETS